MQASPLKQSAPRRNLFLGGVFTAGTLLRLGYLLFNADNAFVGEYPAGWEKLHEYFNWASSGYDWHALLGWHLPLYSFLIGGLHLLFETNLILACQGLSLLSSLLFLFFLPRFIRTISASGRVGDYSFILYAFCPADIIMSGVSLPAVQACFLLFLSAYWLSRHINSGSNHKHVLALSALALNMSCLLCYESWVGLGGSLAATVFFQAHTCYTFKHCYMIAVLSLPLAAAALLKAETFFRAKAATSVLLRAGAWSALIVFSLLQFYQLAASTLARREIADARKASGLALSALKNKATISLCLSNSDVFIVALQLGLGPRHDYEVINTHDEDRTAVLGRLARTDLLALKKGSKLDNLLGGWNFNPQDDFRPAGTSGPWQIFEHKNPAQKNKTPDRLKIYNYFFGTL